MGLCLTTEYIIWNGDNIFDIIANIGLGKFVLPDITAIYKTWLLVQRLQTDRVNRYHSAFAKLIFVKIGDTFRMPVDKGFFKLLKNLSVSAWKVSFDELAYK